MTTPYERLRDLIASIPQEALDRVDRDLNDPDYAPGPVDWREDPDPLGRDWDWVEGEGSELGRSEEAATTARVFRPRPTRVEARPWKLRHSAAVAASLLAACVGGWALSARRPITEMRMSAWVGERLEEDGGGIRIAAPAGDEASADPLIRNVDLPREAAAPSTPNIYAPVRIQEQLAIPEVPRGVVPDASTPRPSRALLEAVRPGSLFYLSFSAASAPSPGTAVVAAFEGGSLRLLWDEVPVAAAEGTAYFGPIKMGEADASYFVVLADRTSRPLLASVAGAIPKGDAGGVDPGSWREALGPELQAAGHRWFGVQRIDVRAGSPAPKSP